jgi:L-ribulose-5-phosphate 3-epimerase
VANLMRTMNHPNVGTLPDFGNWYPADEYGGPSAVGKAGPYYDRYKGLAEMMPFARGVSAKSYAFDAAGNETTTDFDRILRIAVESGFSGYVGIEFEGSAHSEHDGILATKKLLERVMASLG